MGRVINDFRLDVLRQHVLRNASLLYWWTVARFLSLNVRCLNKNDRCLNALLSNKMSSKGQYFEHCKKALNMGSQDVFFIEAYSRDFLLGFQV